MDKKVTVIITFYNPGNMIVDALESVLKQTSNEWEIVLVNDKSTDNTMKYLKNYLKDSRIRLYENKINYGQGKSLNLGLSKTRTPYLLQLDADDWLEKNTIETLLKEMERQPNEVAVVSGNIKIIWQNSKGKTTRTKIRKGQQYKDKYDFLQSNSSIWPRFYRRTALEKIGGWPTDVPYEGRYCEDVLILLSLAEHFRFHWIDEVLYNHRRHDKNLTHNIKEHAKVNEWFIRKTLKKWGDLYQPIFHKNSKGWLEVKSLERKM